MKFRLAHLPLLFFVVCSSSCPLENAGPLPPSHGTKSFTAKIRRSSGQFAPVQNIGSIRIFDPTYATNELKGVTAKYAGAAQFLAGIGLNQDTHPEIGYTPFTQPVFTAVNATSPVPDPDDDDTPISPDTAMQDDAAGIISVPGTAQLPLTDYISGTLDILYYGALQFGTQKQVMTVDIDTGSADLWVPVNCRACSSQQYHASGSSAFKSLGHRFSVIYGAGKVTGTLAQDAVQVGNLVVPEQAFCAVSSESNDFYDEPSDGLLGLAFGSIAQSKRPTFFENLMESKQLAAGAFSVHLARGQETGSEICFGCFDTTKAVGPISWNAVVSRTYWAILMDGLSSDPANPISANLTAAVDTGTTLIYVPDAVAAQFYAQIPGSQAAVQYGEGFYTFPCSAPLSVAFSFGGHDYSVSMNDFNLGRTATDSEDCVGGILALGDGFSANLAIIGDEFLKSWYSVYDYAGNRVGFAPSVNNQGSP
ncbi:hypothetical protein AcW1_008881 [Taiwanofungus camphoratus]|nr:hypothetical protein AcW1_008881 [Antrodia cinnamomea]KAI0958979.1 hypothetical protein AcV7_004646 [Antrodia cinnamomea]